MDEETEGNVHLVPDVVEGPSPEVSLTSSLEEIVQRTEEGFSSDGSNEMLTEKPAERSDIGSPWTLASDNHDSKRSQSSSPWEALDAPSPHTEPKKAPPLPPSIQQNDEAERGNDDTLQVASNETEASDPPVIPPAPSNKSIDLIMFSSESYVSDPPDVAPAPSSKSVDLMIFSSKSESPKKGSSTETPVSGLLEFAETRPQRSEEEESDVNPWIVSPEQSMEESVVSMASRPAAEVPALKSIDEAQEQMQSPPKERLVTRKAMDQGVTDQLTNKDSEKPIMYSFVPADRTEEAVQSELRSTLPMAPAPTEIPKDQKPIVYSFVPAEREEEASQFEQSSSLPETLQATDDQEPILYSFVPLKEQSNLEKPPPPLTQPTNATIVPANSSLSSKDQIMTSRASAVLPDPILAKPPRPPMVANGGNVASPDPIMKTRGSHDPVRAKPPRPPAESSLVPIHPDTTESDDEIMANRASPSLRDPVVLKYQSPTIQDPVMASRESPILDAKSALVSSAPSPGEATPILPETIEKPPAQVRSGSGTDPNLYADMQERPPRAFFGKNMPQESFMAKTRSRATVDLVTVDTRASTASDITSAHHVPLDDDDNAFVINTAVATKRVRVVQLLIVGLVAIGLCLSGSIYVLSSCHFLTAKFTAGQDRQAFDLHYGFWKYSPVSSAFDGHSYCTRYDGYSMGNAPRVSQVASIIAILGGTYAIVVLWYYLIFGRAKYVLWLWAVRLLVVAGCMQFLTFFFFVDDICRFRECSVGPGAGLSIAISIGWLLMAYEMHKHSPVSTLLQELNPQGPTNMFANLEMADFQESAKSYVNRMTGKNDMPSLNQIQRLRGGTPKTTMDLEYLRHTTRASELEIEVASRQYSGSLAQSYRPPTVA